jgi:7-cyano-7-deazaguanine synthase
MKKTLVLLSGGVDSTTCLAIEKSKGHEVIALNMYYWQKHAKEIEAARSIASYYETEYIELDMSRVLEYSDCSLLSHSHKGIKHQAYAEQIKENGIVDTYVPFRNGLFLSAAAAIALSKGADTVVYGGHADDAAGNAYPDCSVAFNNSMNAAIKEGTGGRVKLFAPLATMTKAEVVEAGLLLNAPYHLTWSCYEGGEKPCGKCATCIDRAEAFRLNGVKDPAV